MSYVSEPLDLLNGDKSIVHKWDAVVPQAIVVIVHGYAEHGYRYGHFAERLNDAHISTIAYDQRGHGRASGLQGYIDDFDGLLDDLDSVINRYHTDDIPMFIFGHSMGGLVAASYCINRQPKKISGLITSGAALKLDADLSPLLQKLAPLLGSLLPKMKTQPLDKTYLTRSPAVLEAYMADPLVYTDGTRSKTGAGMIKAIKELSTKFSQLKIPYLGLHGTGEKMTDYRGTERLYNEAAVSDKTLKLYDGLYHELINEPEAEEVMSDIVEWIKNRM